MNSTFYRHFLTVFPQKVDFLSIQNALNIHPLQHDTSVVHLVHGRILKGRMNGETDEGIVGRIKLII